MPMASYRAAVGGGDRRAWERGQGGGVRGDPSAVQTRRRRLLWRCSGGGGGRPRGSELATPWCYRPPCLPGIMGDMLYRMVPAVDRWLRTRRHRPFVSGRCTRRRRGCFRWDPRREYLYPQVRDLEGGAYPGRVSVCRQVAVRSGRCPNLLDSAAAGLASLIRRHATTTRKMTGPMKICGVPTTGGTTSSPAAVAEWCCMPHLMSRAAMLRSASTLNTPQTKQSSTLTGCVGMVATSPAGRRGTGK
jgi:hypothetical protein